MKKNNNKTHGQQLAEKLVKCSQCPFYYQCCDEMKFSLFCPTKSKTTLGDSCAYVDDQGLKFLSIVYLN